jgi:D-alanyl-D-alanine carboxypeptidase
MIGKQIMKKIIAMVCMMIMITACASENSIPLAFTQADLQNILETEWQKFASENKLSSGGLAMQILSPKGNYFISTGMGENMQKSHHFRIASVTKTFTAAAIMLLHQQERLNINDLITANIPGTNTPYVPYDIPYKDKITIKMILMHRAGIFDLSNETIPETAATYGKKYVGWNYISYVMALNDNVKHQFTFDELFGFIVDNKLYDFVPTPTYDKYSYSDTAYCLLGAIIERVSGKTFEEFIRDEFLQPNGLTNTTLPWRGDDRTLPAPFVTGYTWGNGNLTDTTLSNMSPFVANGNIISTPLELASWAKRLFTGKTVLTMDTVQMMMTCLPEKSGSTSAYGLGIDYKPSRGYGHNGAHEGYLTNMYYKPEQDIAYVLFTNVLGNSKELLLIQMAFLDSVTNKIFAEMRY